MSLSLQGQPDEAPSAPCVPVELVIFDCDGVLVDSETIQGQLLHSAIGELGLQTGLEEVVRRFKGAQMTEVVAALEIDLGRSLPLNWVTELEEQRARALAAELRAVPGAQETIERLRTTGVDFCVASQGKLTKTELTLTLTGLYELFDRSQLFSSCMVPEGKPAPDLFLLAARQRGHQPASCLVVEDGWRGLSAARSAGTRALAFACASTEMLFGAEPIDDIRHVLRYLRP